jgi:hypothetical protein
MSPTQQQWIGNIEKAVQRSKRLEGQTPAAGVRPQFESELGALSNAIPQTLNSLVAAFRKSMRIKEGVENPAVMNIVAELASDPKMMAQALRGKSLDEQRAITNAVAKLNPGIRTFAAVLPAGRGNSYDQRQGMLTGEMQ